MTAQTSRQLQQARRPLQRTLQVPGDKSISHRALMLAAVAHGPSRISGLLLADDVHATWRALAALGVLIAHAPNSTGDVHVLGRGYGKLHAAAAAIDCGNSGTTMRLLAGLLAGLPFATQLVGDASLQRRPMARVAQPLRQLGATVRLAAEGVPPIDLVQGTGLRGAKLQLAHASGQVKGALLLAALRAEGTTELTGALSGRDHTERLLPLFGAKLQLGPSRIALHGPQQLSGAELTVPGDISAASFWLAAAALVEGSDVSVVEVGLNPSRMGFVRLLERMGAQLSITQTNPGEAEPRGTIRLSHRPLRCAHLAAEDIPALIDELPLVALLAASAQGTTTVAGAHEARLKESDRLTSIAHNLAAMGVTMQLNADGFVIAGPQPMRSAQVDSFGDHRIAMAMAIAALVASGDSPSVLRDPACVSVSYPEFFTTLAELVSA